MQPIGKDIELSRAREACTTPRPVFPQPPTVMCGKAAPNLQTSIRFCLTIEAQPFTRSDTPIDNSVHGKDSALQLHKKFFTGSNSNHFNPFFTSRAKKLRRTPSAFGEEIPEDCTAYLTLLTKIDFQLEREGARGFSHYSGSLVSFQRLWHRKYENKPNKLAWKI